MIKQKDNKKHSFKTNVMRFLRFAFIFFFASTILAVVAYKWLPVVVTPLMVIRCCQQVARGEKLELHHHWVPITEISEKLPLAVMASEDQLFLKHHGFDTNAIIDAASEKIRGKRSRGGSTISQQTAKNVFLWPNSTWVRKGFEVYFTALIEIIWGKERIMEVYLNSIEMGNGIYGAEAVAQLNFNREASKLNRRQSALIAATLPNPLRFNSANPSRYICKRQKAIMKQMNNVKWTYNSYKTENN